jgi:hypothetical protein
VFEAGIVVGLTGLLWLLQWAANADPELLIWTGLSLVAVGFAFGLPMGAVYHVALYRALRRVDALPRQWWLRPTSLHDRIPACDRGWVLGWCYAGALGFLVILVGIPISAAGAWRLE